MPVGSYTGQSTGIINKLTLPLFKMRFLSIAVFAGLLATSHVAANALEERDRNNNCRAGQGRDNRGNCVDCTPGNYGLGGSNSCQPCPAGSESGQAESSCTCKAGFYNGKGGKTTGESCNACPSGYYSNRGSGQCTKCPAGTYAQDGQCKQCPDGYRSDAGSASCTPRCGAGSYLANGGNGFGYGHCKSCDPGSYAHAGDSSCTKCSPGTYAKNGGAGDCNACPGGYTSDTGATECRPVRCPAGKYANGGNCSPCPGGTYSDANASSCTQCPRDTYAPGGSPSCTRCPRNTNAMPGASQCSTTCKAGQYLNGRNCDNCPAGTYSQAGATSCTDCPEDTYSRDGASSCTQCPSGKGCGSRSRGPEQCVDKCPDGQVSQNGHCRNCPAGSYANGNQCSDCPAGSVSRPGSKSCTQCPGGSVPSNNKKDCYQCPRNTYSDGDHCSSCPGGKTSSPGSSSCNPEPSGRPRTYYRSEPDCKGQGMQRCDILYGSGGTECVNVLTTLDSCGGCVGPEGDYSSKYTGRDCGAIPNVDKVQCKKGHCEIKSCRPGFEPHNGECVAKQGYYGKNGTSYKRGLAAHHHQDSIF
ncbi:Proprotein convertase subtilisin/kexin type 5 [Ceratobasidium theobromae]|uniref:Proprotein convertase subtilisin/kexin type 5 n=1 Tax=Ceratobasidium theobromae TaxID=1582974 RepID=A0A5N5QNV1_9AGAM|nr:Proprotein convertase subtilisin/kexin type 5 [Ceratobasidium theobromae]